MHIPLPLLVPVACLCTVRLAQLNQSIEVVDRAHLPMHIPLPLLVPVACLCTVRLAQLNQSIEVVDCAHLLFKTHHPAVDLVNPAFMFQWPVSWQLFRRL
jgi:hypothetical protein